MSTSNKLTIVIVNYNSSKNTVLLVKSLSNISKIIREVIIIDNNSSDADRIILKNIQKVTKVFNRNNLGFAKAVNQGISLSTTPFVLLLNPDCTIQDDSPIKTFNKIVSNHKIGVIGGKIYNPTNNEYQLTATSRPNFLTGLFEFTNLKKIFPNNKYTQKFWIEKNKKHVNLTKVFSLCGAYVFLRKENLFLNEKYFLYLEDLDLGNQINKYKLEAWFDPESFVTHIGGSSNESKYRTVLKYWYASRKIYFKDNLPPIQGNILYIIFSIEELLLKIYHFFTNSPNE